MSDGIILSGEAPAGASTDTIEQAGELRSARIESLRAIAALGVLVGHIVVTAALNNPIPTSTSLPLFRKILYGGGFGVFFFFALTGYLLFWPFAKRDYGGGAAVDLKRYAVNRALRILPLYYAVVIIVLALSHESHLGVWGRFLTFTENFSHGTVGQYISVAWSLVVEVQFYILLPLGALVLWRISAGSARRATAVLIGLALISYYFANRHVYTPAVPEPLWRFNMPANFMFFVPGMLLALIRARWAMNGPPAWLRGVLLRSDLWILATVPLWAAVVLGNYDLVWLIGIAGFLTIGACVLPLRPGLLTRALEWRLLAALGVASYSLYLWHGHVIDVLVNDVGVSTALAPLAAIAIPVAIAAAVLSYGVIERPFLRLRRRWSSASAPTQDPAEAPAPTS